MHLSVTKRFEMRRKVSLISICRIHWYQPITDIGLPVGEYRRLAECFNKIIHFWEGVGIGNRGAITEAVVNKKPKRSVVLRS